MDIQVDMAESVGFGTGVIGIIYAAYMLFVLAFGVGGYVLQSISFYSIATRRGIKHAWLSWIPVGSLWILGCISDQYQYVVKRQVKNKRKIMLGISIAVLALAVLVFVLCGVLIFNMVTSDYGYTTESQIVGSTLVSLFGMVAVSMIMSGLSVALVILQYICLYDLYTSCDPSNNITYLLLSIFIGVLMPILLLICRNKDLGMPPRKVKPAEIPVQSAWENMEDQL